MLLLLRAAMLLTADAAFADAADAYYACYHAAMSIYAASATPVAAMLRAVFAMMI